MPRNKRGSSAPQGGGRGRQGLQGRFVRAPAIGQGHDLNAIFTLADEARRTLQDDHSAWENATLRKMPVKFLSAGSINMNDDPKNLSVDDKPVATPPGQEPTLLPVDPDNADPHNGRRKYRENDGHSSSESGAEQEVDKEVSGTQPFFFDVQRRRSNDQDGIVVAIPERRSSPDSASDSEEIIFRGRNPMKRNMVQETMSLTTIHTELRAVEEQLPTAIESISETRTTVTNDILGVGPSNRPRKPRTKPSNSDEDASIADYIANMRENNDFGSLQNLGFSDQDSSDSDESEEKCTKEIEKATTKEPDNQTPAREAPRQDLDGDADFKGLFSSSSESSDADTDPQLAQDETVNEFDFMDWERPSLRKKNKKWSKMSSQFQDLDPDLEQVIQAAWNNDRLRKSERKKQREEMRALGLLGKKSETGDLMAKYPNGISLQQVAEELKAFLIRNDESLALPPMDQHARKIVHELANKFNLKSKSIGQGEQRRPTLYRKKGTLHFEEQRFDSVFRRINRKFFPRTGTADKQRRGASNRIGDSAARIRDGEIVGAGAPELGADNRGRTMLEKMGWSSGMALGALDNKGILQPVTQTMKRSKAGLG